MLDSTGVMTQFASDCVSCVLKGNKNEIIVCLVTATIAGIVRWYELRKIKNK